MGSPIRRLRRHLPRKREKESRLRARQPSVLLVRIALAQLLLPDIFPLPRQLCAALAEAAGDHLGRGYSVGPEIAEVLAHRAPRGKDLFLLVERQRNRPHRPLGRAALLVRIAELPPPFVADRLATHPA